MKINYIGYLKYVFEHKVNVGIECFKRGLFIHSIFHDLSKLFPSEFIGYAKYFYGDKKRYKDEFLRSWLLHQHRNKHHWDYWVGSDGKAVEMPLKNIKQMVCDWHGMSRKFGGSAYEYFLKNENRINLHPKTRDKLINKVGFK